MKRSILTAGLIIGMIGSVFAQPNVEKAKRFRVAKTASLVETHAKVHLMQTAAQAVTAKVLENKSPAQLDELGPAEWEGNSAQLNELGVGARRGRTFAFMI